MSIQEIIRARVWVAIITALFIVIYLPLIQRATLAPEKKENDKQKDE